MAEDVSVRDEVEDRAECYWKRAVAVRTRALALSTPEARTTLLKVADDYERMAEALTRVVLLGHDSEQRIAAR